jgi:hypothetical protein
MILSVNDWQITLHISNAFHEVSDDGLLVNLQTNDIGGWKIIFAIAVRRKSSEINAGIPQGYVIGPILFLFFITEFVETTTNPDYSFADDSTLHVHIPTGPLKTAESLDWSFLVLIQHFWLSFSEKHAFNRKMHRKAMQIHDCADEFKETTFHRLIVMILDFCICCTNIFMVGVPINCLIIEIYFL